MRPSRYGWLAIVNVAGLLTPVVRGDEQAIAWKDLPAAVRQSAEQAVAGVKWSESARADEEDETVYRLKGTDAKGLPVEVILRSSVHIELVETGLDLENLPRPLADALKPIPGVKWSKAVLKAGEEETTYEAIGTDAKGRELSVTVTEDGRSEVRTELEVFDVPSNVIDALKAKRPMFRPDSVALVDEQGSVAYVFEGNEGQDDPITLSVSPDGKTVAVVDDDEGDDQDDDE